jgi:hypothetical protein
MQRGRPQRCWRSPRPHDVVHPQRRARDDLRWTGWDGCAVDPSLNVTAPDAGQRDLGEGARAQCQAHGPLGALLPYLAGGPLLVEAGRAWPCRPLGR